MKYSRESYGFGFLGATSFSLMSLGQTSIGLSLNKSWDYFTITFAAMAIGSGVLAVYFGRELAREMLKRRSDQRQQSVSGYPTSQR